MHIHTRSEIAAPSITAAAQPVSTTGITTGIGDNSGWKKEAWDFYDTVGELRYVCQWLSNALGRVTLYCADIDPATGDPTDTPTTNQTAAAIVTDIAGGPAGQATLLSKLATQLTVPGEGWIAVIAKDGLEQWHVLSADELINRAGTITLKLDDNTDHQFNPTTDLLFRIHRPHPRNSRESDSPVRAALNPLREMTRSSATIDGAAKSRLAGNGMLLLPQEISMPLPKPPTPNPDAPGLPQEPTETVDQKVSAQDVMVQLQQVMTTAISDPTSAAALVPIVLKAPGDTLDKIRHLRFDSEVTKMALDTRDSAIRRLSLSLEVPPEILTGLSAASHWNAWQIDESSIKTHIAPLMTIICDALTRALLRPLMESMGQNPDGLLIWFDTSNLSAHPNRADDAVAAFDRGAISTGTLRRALGFTDMDAPDTAITDERRVQLAMEMVKGAPSLFPLLADILGMPVTGTAATPATPSTPADPAPAPGAPDA